ncbi:MAG: DUF438 domain-containing protein [Anaerolineae bacterium]|nr:DUF438 domain-containing protein [Anaerolineae bacterium]
MSEYIDNVSQRKKMLKEALAGLHQGKSVEEVQAIFAELVKVATYDDISEAEQMLIAEGLPAAEIQKLCDLHVAVVRDSLDAQPDPDSIPGHPIHTLRAENEIAETMLQQLEGLLVVPGAEALELVRDRLAQLVQFERHYQRKENLLFPYLERYGFTGPSQVMWGIHDEIRAAWKQLTALLADLGQPQDWTARLKQLRAVFEPMRTAMQEMFYKEEKILFPTAMERLSEADWGEIRRQEAELGYFVVRPGLTWQPPAPAAPKAEPTPQAAPAFSAPGIGVMLSLATGVLSPEQLNLMLTHLPFDITFVDENDEVRYFTQGKERIFERQPAIIGRKVQLCHPPQSMDKVQRILDDFRAGTRDVAEFWIKLNLPQGESMMEKFVHIRYFALRDAAGTYRGTIEVTQDVAPIHALQGEKRLLDD